jgi:hypothetical protein
MDGGGLGMGGDVWGGALDSFWGWRGGEVEGVDGDDLFVVGQLKIGARGRSPRPIFGFF